MKSLLQAERKFAIFCALLLLVPVHVILQGFSMLGIAGAIALAVLIGESWSRYLTGQVATPMITGVAFLLSELPWLDSNPYHTLGLLIATTFVALCSAYLGLRREMRIME